MRCWGNNCVLHRCLKDILPVDAHVKAPKIPSTNHWTYTHKPGDQAHFTHWTILCAWPECIPLTFLEDETLSGSPQSQLHWVKIESSLPRRCSEQHAKQHELTQHIVYRGYCNTDQNAGCGFSVVSPSQSFFFPFFFLNVTLRGKSS